MPWARRFISILPGLAGVESTQGFTPETDGYQNLILARRLVVYADGLGLIYNRLSEAHEDCHIFNYFIDAAP